MREIKFRGKRVDNGEWVYGFIAITQLYPYDGTKQGAYIWKIPCAENCIPVIPESVGQYTGLKDKNGKEIYEGDVVDCWGGEYSQGYWQYTKQIIVDLHNYGDMLWLVNIENCEVIGNIHESNQGNIV